MPLFRRWFRVEDDPIWHKYDSDASDLDDAIKTICGTVFPYSIQTKLYNQYNPAAKNRCESCHRLVLMMMLVS